jgi:hypothetical protein
LESFAESSAQWPLLNIPGALLRDWMPLIDEYHYCEYGHRHPFSALIFVNRYVHVVGFTSLYTSSVNPCREFCRCPVPIYVSTVRLFMAIYSIHTVLVPMLRPVPLLCTYSITIVSRERISTQKVIPISTVHLDEIEFVCCIAISIL